MGGFVGMGDRCCMGRCVGVLVVVWVGEYVCQLL